LTNKIRGHDRQRTAKSGHSRSAAFGQKQSLSLEKISGDSKRQYPSHPFPETLEIQSFQQNSKIATRSYKSVRRDCGHLSLRLALGKYNNASKGIAE
jgi:hypothetical protein